MYKLHEVMAMLEDDPDSVPAAGVDIVIQPPDNACAEVTDEDSGDEETVTINNLPPSQLRADAETQRPPDDDSSTDSDDDARHLAASSLPPAKKKMKVYTWRKGDLALSPITSRTWNPKDVIELRESPVDLFLTFFDAEVFGMIVTQSNNYAARKNKNLDMTVEELKCFIGILLLSGYVEVPRRRMYWQQSEDTHNSLVAAAMTRNRFDEIMSCLHLTDNDRLEKADKFAKVRPLFDELNKAFLANGPHEENHSVDEAMVPYFGRHGCKQFIRGKPIRYGFKLWVGATRLGYVNWMEPYQGAGTRIDPKYKDLGLGAGVILQYADVISSIGDDPYHIFFDNFFTSIPLLAELSQRKLKATGTIRENRTSKCPLQDTKAMKKTERGSYDFRLAKDENIVVCKWNDNSVVSIASNALSVRPTHNVTRYSQKKKKNISVTQPHLVRVYNENMGGVDRCDQNISLYRISVRGKKWYFPLICHCIDLAEQNAWQLHKARKGSLDHLQFRRRVVTALLETNAKSSKGAGRPSQTEHVDSRYDRLDHLVEPQEKQTRCRHCHQKCTTRCSKCNIGLHVKCFIDYHKK